MSIDYWSYFFRPFLILVNMFWNQIFFIIKRTPKSSVYLNFFLFFFALYLFIDCLDMFFSLLIFTVFSPPLPFMMFLCVHFLYYALQNTFRAVA